MQLFCDKIKNKREGKYEKVEFIKIEKESPRTIL